MPLGRRKNESPQDLRAARRHLHSRISLRGRLTPLLLAKFLVTATVPLTALLLAPHDGVRAVFRQAPGWVALALGLCTAAAACFASSMSRRLHRYHAENRELLAAVERGYLETLRALVNSIEAKDPYTAGHSQRTAEIAVAIGRALELDADALKELEVGGLLHDIGKIGIAESILRKPAALDEGEMHVMRGHPAIGDAIVHDIEILHRIRATVRSHHERWDGSGYPDGLAGEEIPLGARIIAAADTYDAITSDRCYQPGRQPAEAIPILRQLAVRQLDPRVVDGLLRALVHLGQLSAEEIAADAARPPATQLEARPRRPTLELTPVPLPQPARRDVN